MNSKLEWHWFVSDSYEVIFAEGKRNPDCWYIRHNGFPDVRVVHAFDSENDAVKFAKKSLRTIIGGYKEKLDRLNKR